jgi:hypothetical protein
MKHHVGPHIPLRFQYDIDVKLDPIFLRYLVAKIRMGIMPALTVVSIVRMIRDDSK